MLPCFWECNWQWMSMQEQLPAGTLVNKYTVNKRSRRGEQCIYIKSSMLYIPAKNCGLCLWQHSCTFILVLPLLYLPAPTPVPAQRSINRVWHLQRASNSTVVRGRHLLLRHLAEAVSKMSGRILTAPTQNFRLRYADFLSPYVFQQLALLHAR